MPVTKSASKARPSASAKGANEAISAKQIIAALDGLSVGDLRQIVTAADSIIREKADGAKRALKEEMQRRAADLGISIRDLFGEPSQPAVRGRGKAPKKTEAQGVAPKYKSPDGELWSGRGRMPKWLHAAQAEGKSKEDFLIDHR